jgi:hypothetical protein
MTTQTFYTDSNTPVHSTRTLVCWKSIFAGVLVAFLTYFILTSLGAGIGGFRAAHLIDQNENGTGLLTGAGIWLGLSCVLSLFLGSYFATRVSATPNRKIGGAHGVVIAAIFFGVLLNGAGPTLGSLTQVSGSMITNPGTGASTVVVTDADAERSARTFADMGWILFVTFALGTAAAVLGGYEGSTKNTKRPMHAVLTPVL